MQTYRAALKARVVQRLMGPRAISANRLAATVGVSQETRSRWLRQARSVHGMTAPKKRTPRWSGAEKRRVVLAAEGLEDEALGTPPTRRPSGPSPEAQRIVALERELRRKEAARAETAALLVLKKQVQVIWADEDDTTDPMRVR